MSLEFARSISLPARARRYSEQHLREWGRLGNLHTRLTTGDAPARFSGKTRVGGKRARRNRVDASGDRHLPELPGVFA